MAENPSNAVRIVVIDDDENFLKATSRALTRLGCDVVPVVDALEGLQAACAPDVDVVLSDVAMPNLDGFALLAELRRRKVDVEVVFMTGLASVAAAVEAVKSGAYDYLTKPFTDFEHVALTMRKASERRTLRRRTLALEEMLTVKEQFEDLVGHSPKMTEVFKLVDAVAYSSSTVLIQGESGTGKELVARALHRRSPRRNKPFLAVNCAALTETLLESELFGHVKGAFTGAIGNKKGLFQAADGGTIFLDEIGDMPLATQVRVLRVLQEGELRQVGATDNVSVDVRVIAATHVDLTKARAAGKMREDLFYRLNVIAIHLPPLRDRPEDIPPLVHHFVKRYAAKAGKQITSVSAKAMTHLCTYAWPGNVRELENAVERAVVIAKTPELTEAELPPTVIVAEGSPAGDVEPFSLTHMPFQEARKLTLRAFERRYAMGLLRQTKGNVTRAAELAGMDRSNFRRMLKEQGIAARQEAPDGAPTDGDP